MTGRDLIIYILENGLEDRKMFEDGTLPGYVTIEDAAIMTDTGIFTIEALIITDNISTIKIGDKEYIPIKDISPSKI